MSISIVFNGQNLLRIRCITRKLRTGKIQPWKGRRPGLHNNRESSYFGRPELCPRTKMARRSTRMRTFFTVTDSEIVLHGNTRQNIYFTFNIYKFSPFLLSCSQSWFILGLFLNSLEGLSFSLTTVTVKNWLKIASQLSVFKLYLKTMMSFSASERVFGGGEGKGDFSSMTSLNSLFGFWLVNLGPTGKWISKSNQFRLA